MTTVFIYGLFCPVAGQIRYVGKSSNPKRRFQVHLKSKKTCYRTNWIRALAAQGLTPVLEILDEVPESEWQSWEVAYIEFFREAGCDLTNLTPGGDCGPIMCGSANPFFGKKHSSEAKIELSNQKRGKNHPCYGKHLSPETRAKISAANSGENGYWFGKKFSVSVCAKLSKSSARHNLGKRFSPETCLKMSVAKKGCAPWNKGKTGLQVAWNKGIKKTT